MHGIAISNGWGRRGSVYFRRLQSHFHAQYFFASPFAHNLAFERERIFQMIVVGSDPFPHPSRGNNTMCGLFCPRWAKSAKSICPTKGRKGVKGAFVFSSSVNDLFSFDFPIGVSLVDFLLFLDFFQSFLFSISPYWHCYTWFPVINYSVSLTYTYIHKYRARE